MYRHRYRARALKFAMLVGLLAALAKIL